MHALRYGRFADTEYLIVTLAFLVAAVLGEGCLYYFTFLSCRFEVALSLLEKQSAALYHLVHFVKTIEARCYKQVRLYH